MTKNKPDAKSHGNRARDVKGLVLFARPVSLAERKNRSEAEPDAARPGAQNDKVKV